MPADARDLEGFMQPASDMRRTPDGAIDYTFYHTRVRALRDRALRSAFLKAVDSLRQMAGALFARFAARRS